MKKILSLIALLSVCQMAQASFLCFDLGGCFQGVYRPGLYLGSEIGYASIQTPKHGCVVDHTVKGSNGHFAYGLFAGFNGFTCFRNFYFGIEGGYHNNGYTHFRFPESKHHHRLESYDWGGSATFTYSFLCSADLFVKVGGARVTERIRHKHHHHNEPLLPRLSRSEWAPTVDTGIGYSVWDWLNLSVSYRGVYGRNQDNINSRLKLKKGKCHDHFDWQGISTVHAVYGGLNVIF